MGSFLLHPTPTRLSWAPSVLFVFTLFPSCFSPSVYSSRPRFTLILYIPHTLLKKKKKKSVETAQLEAHVKTVRKNERERQYRNRGDVKRKKANKKEQKVEMKKARERERERGTWKKKRNESFARTVITDRCWCKWINNPADEWTEKWDASHKGKRQRRELFVSQVKSRTSHGSASRG